MMEIHKRYFPPKTRATDPVLFDVEDSLLNAENYAYFGYVVLLAGHKWKPNLARRGKEYLVRDESLADWPGSPSDNA